MTDYRALRDDCIVEEVLAVKELAAALRISERTVYRMIRQGTLDQRRYRTERVGGQWRIRRRVVRHVPAAMDRLGHV